MSYSAISSFAREPLEKHYWFQEGPGVRNWQFTTSGIKLLNVGNITTAGHLDLGKTSIHLSVEEVDRTYRHFLLDAGDLVIASSGISFDIDGLLRTKTAFINQKELPLCLNTSTIRFKSKDEELASLRFLRYWFDAQDFRLQITRLVTGSAQQNFGPSHLKQLTIPFPSLPEQKRIAAILDKADRLRRQRRLAQTLSDSFLQSVFIKMFGDGKSVPFVNVVQDPSEIIKKWRWAKLKTVAKLTTGHTPSRNISDYWGGDIPWITTTDIRKLDGTVATKTSEQTNALGIKNSSAVVHPANTVCLCRTASVGFVTMMGKPMATSQDFVNWTCGDELNPFYLMFALIFSRPYIKSLSSGTTHKTIYFPTVEEFQTLIPPLPLQEKFAAIVQKFERIRRQQREATRQAEHLFQTLLHRAFNGSL